MLLPEVDDCCTGTDYVNVWSHLTSVCCFSGVGGDGGDGELLLLDLVQIWEGEPGELTIGAVGQ